MRCDVIAVRVGNEGEAFRIPGIEPKIVRWQINAAFVTDFDHGKNLELQGRECYRSHASYATFVYEMAGRTFGGLGWQRARTNEGTTARARSGHSVADSGERRFLF